MNRLAVVIALALSVPMAATARAADRIYWTSFDSGNAIDPVRERVYWANQQQSKINWANPAS